MRNFSTKVIDEIRTAVMESAKQNGHTLFGLTSMIGTYVATESRAEAHEAVVGKYIFALERYPFIQFMKDEFLAVHSGLNVHNIQQRRIEIQKFDYEIERIDFVISQIQKGDLLHAPLFFETNSNHVSFKSNLLIVTLNQFLENMSYHHFHCRANSDEENFNLYQHALGSAEKDYGLYDLSEHLKQSFFKFFEEYHWLKSTLGSPLERIFNTAAAKALQDWVYIDAPAPLVDHSEWRQYEEFNHDKTSKITLFSALMDSCYEQLSHLLETLKKQTNENQINATDMHLLLYTFRELIEFHNILCKFSDPTKKEKYLRCLEALKLIYPTFLKLLKCSALILPIESDVGEVLYGDELLNKDLLQFEKILQAPAGVEVIVESN